MEENSPAIQFLVQNNIQFKLFRSSQNIKTIFDAAQERNQVVSQIIRTIIFRLDQNKYIYTLIPGDTRVDWKTLRKICETNRLSMANPIEVEQTSGYKIGTVSPFGIKTISPIILDPTVLTHTKISIGSGIARVAIIMNSADILNLIPDSIKTKIIE